MDKLIYHYKAFWTNYVNFTDRTSKAGYWWAFLGNVIVGAIVGLISGILQIQALTYIYELAILIPSLALDVRRLRDIGKQWYYILIGLIPLVGPILLIVWYCGDTQSSEGVQTN